MEENKENKVVYFTTDEGEEVPFFVVEETKIAGENYLLVTDSEEDEADAYIFREVSENENDSFYEMVEDEEKINALSKVFADFCVKNSVCSPVCSRCTRPFSSEIRSLAVPAAPHFRRKQALELPFSVTTPSCENGIAERPQTLRYPEIKNKFSADNG